MTPDRLPKVDIYTDNKLASLMAKILLFLNHITFLEFKKGDSYSSADFPFPTLFDKGTQYSGLSTIAKNINVLK